MKLVFGFLLAASVPVVHAAINLDGSQAVDPVSEDEPAPIADILAYIPDQHDCPLPCRVDYANVHKWTPYYTVERLERCDLPMLLHFSVLQLLDNPDTSVLIRSCTLGIDPADAQDRTVINATSTEIENPKNGTDLFEISLNVAPACAIDGRETQEGLVVMTGGGRQSGRDIDGLLDGMKDFFDTKENCDENFLFAYHKKTVAGVHIGAGLGKSTAASALESLRGHFQDSDGSAANQTVAQICGGDRGPETVFGLSVDTTGDLSGIQQTVVAWSRGDCAAGTDFARQDTLKVKVFDIASAPLTVGPAGNTTTPANTTSSSLDKRAVCKYIRVESGDGCASLAAKCAIRGADFIKFNPAAACTATGSALWPGDYVCCSAGDPYTEPKPQAPKPNADGTCAVHLISNGDTCAQLAKTHGLTEVLLEGFNKGKTWGWTECKAMLAGYNMCLSTGASPLPPPQQGTECGPLVPGTVRTDMSIPMTDLNPCPLKACCSNWGYCGPFPAHCDINAPKGGGPGTKLEGFQSTCISNCGIEIKQNSGPPAVFSRIGYYESWNLGRKCLWLRAQDANTDGSYTHMHWGFAEIDPNTWTVVIKDPHNQWQDFKKLTSVKRIVSFGGWAYSTEAATFNIIRRAIINNRELFATNAAKFIMDEGLDGIDIDWEYPGAPDILVNGVPIGQPGDGVAYLRFLTTLKAKLPSKSVSIAAPASYWYLKAFPIDRIAAVIDYIVYMTYDLHGQWDYGNVNAFDSCASGKCIRSHVNLTETVNTLGIITKAGVPNNKIFVGESSYGRSFRMATDGCWGPLCEFTGTRLESDANPGRCTDTRGYISNAEINEIIRSGQGRQFHDGESNSDILLYKGDYVSYMTPVTKDTRRRDWQRLNFAGSIDWAVDLQAFGSADMNVPVKPPTSGAEGCVMGESLDFNMNDLCGFACTYGFCPESICTCIRTGPVEPLPPVVSTAEYIAYDEFDVDIQRLCKFACKYGFCPEDTCAQPVVDEWEDGIIEPQEPMVDTRAIRDYLKFQCDVFKTRKNSDFSKEKCRKACKPKIDEAIANGATTTNYGCMGFFEIGKPIPWAQFPGTSDPDWVVAPGQCMCDNFLLNEIADIVIDALPIIAQIGCYIVMSSLKLILDIGLDAIPAGRIVNAGMDAAAVVVQIANYAYPEEENPLGAFEWWLSPCGGSALVPEEIKRIFDILSLVPTDKSSYRQPKNLKKGSGKKGDSANPTDRALPKAGTGSGPNGLGSNGVKKQKKCRVPAKESTKLLMKAKNTLRVQSCVSAGPGGLSTTTKEEWVVTAVSFGAQATTVSATCSLRWSQACFHYSSVVSNNPRWSVLTCPGSTASSSDSTRSRGAVATWSAQHHDSWRQAADRWNPPQPKVNGGTREPGCDADEYPPIYLLADSSTEIQQAGKTGGQLIRYLMDSDNRGGAEMWGGMCFTTGLKGLTTGQFMSMWKASPASKQSHSGKAGAIQHLAEVRVDAKPRFTISKFEHAANPPPDAGMSLNGCWPRNKAPGDPGMALWSWDPWYTANPAKFKFDQKYDPPTNGV
ncbi:glycoside hydrolase family 18 protein [Plectosphaerella plurivora]|uniref:chitinase n=1 Tax=Plectosphaerella plurivora TaxID=936078 RepID=A0A9P8VEV3_9PEZI|nr:glycoside hydrolase family 18 protein [Plectosphaerella plurivora]